MREALARIDQDFVLSEPRRKGRGRGNRPSFFQRPKQVAQFAAKYTNLLVGLIFAALLTAVLVNALIWQKSRHPAPLFARSVALELPAETHTQAPLPVARPAPPAASVAAASVAAEPSAAAEEATNLLRGRDPMAEAAALQAAPKPAPARDPIAQLLRPSAPPESSKTILAAQRALMKLGYVVKPDGVMRPATKQALEKFERDRGLPVHGHLSPKVLRELATQSGIAMD